MKVVGICVDCHPSFDPDPHGPFSPALDRIVRYSIYIASPFVGLPGLLLLPHRTRDAKVNATEQAGLHRGGGACKESLKK